MPETLVAILSRARRVLLVAHINPDGDALGSQLALGNMLRELGKEVVLYAEQPVSHLYAFLPGSGDLVNRLDAPATFDCAVALDCGDAGRLGRNRDVLLTVDPFLVIDHHSGHRPFGSHRWVDEHRSATAELVYELGRRMGAPVSYETAFCLYAAIVSDSGSFKYSSTTPATLRIAADLVEHGVQPSEVAGRLYDNYTMSRLALLQEVLRTLELDGDGALAFIHVTREMFARTGATDEDCENFINYPRALAQVKIAAFVKESNDGLVSVSLRSKGREHDVAQVARQFGGGGHRNAAGFKQQGITVDALCNQLRQALLPLVAKVSD